jgi:uncharacterized protein (UPF0332 family)
LDRSRESYKRGDDKWATIKAYYAMFHAARALLYAQRYRERSHRALVTALRELYVKTGKLPPQAVEDLENAVPVREEADYGLVSSGESANEILKDEAAFLSQVKPIVAKRRYVRRTRPYTP